MNIQNVGVAGCGLMGSGIAEIAAKAGYDVTVREINEDAVAAGRARIQKSLARAVSKGKLEEAEQERITSRIAFTTELDDLANCGLVIEAIVESLEAKSELFAHLDSVCNPDAIFASNTSSLPITEIAASTSRRERFVGLHFFNPVPVMKLVEVVRTIATSQETFDAAMDFAKSVAKVPVAAKDNSGFVVNLLLVPYMLDAIRQLERGVATVQDIDTAMTLGCGYPMGPFTLCDFVGIDTLHLIAEIMFDEYREERYAPPPLLKRMVALGRFGRKAGAGFYDWTKEGPVPLEL